MQPGVIVKLNGSGSIDIQRAVHAVGNAAQPESLIVFTSYRDDFYGGDTNNDGNVSVPAVDDWNYVTIEGTAIDAQCQFQNCVFRYGGSGATFGVLRCVNSSPSVDGCLFSNNTCGISVEGASNPTVHNSSLYANTQFAINNTGNSFCVNADQCWWGATTGPNDASATADICLLGANAGTGDKVSNNVDYAPFKTVGLVNPLIGDVSLNGQVLAYDASLVMQANVFLITLSPLEETVSDVDGDNVRTAFDATQILQYVVGILRAFPAVNNSAGQASPDVLAARRLRDSAKGQFTLSLDQPVRDGDSWLVGVRATGTAPVYAFELRVEGGGAATLSDLSVNSNGGALQEHNVADGAGVVAVASATVRRRAGGVRCARRRQR
jgi:parallel beta-helix repeat protein